MIKSIILFLFASSCFSINAQSITQQDLSNGGGTYEQSNGSMQFNIGEPLTETYNNSNGQLYQGFEQGSYLVVSVEETLNTDVISVDLYPNPTDGVFSLNISSSLNSSFNLQITDGLGKLIFQETSIQTLPYQFNLEQYESGVYYLTIVNDSGKYMKTYKVIKQ